MQILHRFVCSIKQYSKEISDPEGYWPDQLPAVRSQSLSDRTRLLYAAPWWTWSLMDRSECAATCAVVASVGVGVYFALPPLCHHPRVK